MAPPNVRLCTNPFGVSPGPAHPGTSFVWRLWVTLTCSFSSPAISKNTTSQSLMSGWSSLKRHIDASMELTSAVHAGLSRLRVDVRRPVRSVCAMSCLQCGLLQYAAWCDVSGSHCKHDPSTVAVPLRTAFGTTRAGWSRETAGSVVQDDGQERGVDLEAAVVFD